MVTCSAIAQWSRSTEKEEDALLVAAVQIWIERSMERGLRMVVLLVLPIRKKREEMRSCYFASRVPRD